MFSAVKKPLSMPMNSGHRLADGDPTVPMVTVSTARAGATNSSVAIRDPSVARPNIFAICMTTLRVHPHRTLMIARPHAAFAYAYLNDRGAILFAVRDSAEQFPSQSPSK